MVYTYCDYLALSMSRADSVCSTANPNSALFSWPLPVSSAVLGCFASVTSFKVANPPFSAFVAGLTAFGVLTCMISTYAYCIDGFRQRANQIFIMNVVFKNFTSFGVIHFINSWVERVGPEVPLFVFGGTAVFLCLLAIPIYIYGKRFRSLWARHDPFLLLNIR